jgi:hypothetical protein
VSDHIWSVLGLQAWSIGYWLHLNLCLPWRISSAAPCLYPISPQTNPSHQPLAEVSSEYVSLCLWIYFLPVSLKQLPFYKQKQFLLKSKRLRLSHLLPHGPRYLDRKQE